MLKRSGFSIALIFLAIVLLLVSCTPPVARIISITHEPAYPAAGEKVTFIIEYENASAEDSLAETILQVTYDQDLSYSAPDSDPQPADDFTDRNELVWKLGDLHPGQGGKVIVGFIVSPETALEKYELAVNASLSGTTSQGGSSTSSQQAVTNLLDHPTPVPTPLPVIEQYQDGQVTVELPWQPDIKLALHSKQQDFTFDPMSIPVTEGYSLLRSVIYLDIFDEKENPVYSFSPPISLTIKYTASDINTAGSENNITVLIFERGGEAQQGQEGKWIACDEKAVTDKTKCTITGTTPFSESNGYGTITVAITAWTSGTGLGKR